MLTQLAIGSLLPVALVGLSTVFGVAFTSLREIASGIIIGLSSLVIMLGLASWVGINIHAVFLLMIALGALLSVSAVVQSVAKRTMMLRLAAAAIIACLIFLAFGSTVIFNSLDDVSGYLPLVENARQNAHLGLDSFNQNRLALGLPGMLLLQAVVANIFGSITFVNYFEHVIPITAILLWIYGGPAKIYEKIEINAILIFLIILGQAGFFGYTLSPNLSIAAFLVVYFDRYSRVVRGDGTGLAKNRDVWVTILLAAACLSFKGTALLFIGVVSLMVWLNQWSPSRAWILRQSRAVLLIGVAGLVLLVPMFAQQLRSSGTAYFPFTGAGYYISSYSEMPFVTSGLANRLFSAAIAASSYLPMVFLAGVTLLAAPPPSRRAWIWAAQIAALAISALLLTAASGNVNNGYRYIYPLMLAFMLINSRPLLAGVRGRLVRAVALALLVYLTYQPTLDMSVLGQRMLANFELLSQGQLGGGERARIVLGQPAFDFGDPIERQNANRMQSLIPEGAPALLTVDNPLPFDYVRNMLYTTGNCPGLSSLPPGVPLDGSAKSLAEYMRNLNILYAIVERQDPQVIDNFLRWAQDDAPWIKVCGRASLSLGKALMASDTLFDDGRFRVVSFAPQLVPAQP